MSMNFFAFATSDDSLVTESFGMAMSPMLKMAVIAARTLPTGVIGKTSP